MKTPDTADVRAWARKNGHAVSDRGRLPAEVHAAYLADQGGAGTTSSAKARTTAKAPAGARAKAPAKASAKASAKAKAPAKASATRAPTTAPKPEPQSVSAPVAAPESAEVDRVTALEQQLAALVARVAVLERPASAPAAAHTKPSRFRRRNG